MVVNFKRCHSVNFSDLNGGDLFQFPDNPDDLDVNMKLSPEVVETNIINFVNLIQNTLGHCNGSEDVVPLSYKLTV